VQRERQREGGEEKCGGREGNNLAGEVEAGLTEAELEMHLNEPVD
jgi:hypothetical protein